MPEHPKQPHIEIEQDKSMMRWEISIWLEDESNYCQVYVDRQGRIEFMSKEQLDANNSLQVQALNSNA